MMRSMFSGVSGLKSHQTKMDVIGNNIANVNTVGFKSGRVTFQEIFSQTLKGASSSDSASGKAGTNPMQVGLGAGISAIDSVMTRGSAQMTDNPTDLMIEGDGFFVLKGSKNDTYKFSRAGNFGIDENGNLNLNGFGVCGWDPTLDTASNEYVFDTNKPAEPLNIFRNGETGENKMMLGARATTSAYLSGNLNSATEVGGTFTVPTIVYDSLGNEYKANLVFEKGTPSGSPPETEWTVTVESPINDAKGNPIATSVSIDGTDTITFDSNGRILNPPTDTLLLIEPETDMGSGEISISLDFKTMTMNSSDSSAKPYDVNGYPPGDLVSFDIGSDGIINGIYSNGQQQPLGIIALAAFSNPSGLTKVGNNMYMPSANSGDYTNAVRPGTNGAGSLNPGSLEMSNVDLSREFTDMIVTQRGFQANSRIITTSDEMLQELVNLKR